MGRSWGALRRVFFEFLVLLRLLLALLGALWALLSVFKSALGGIWAKFWLDFEGFGKDCGILAQFLGVRKGFWESLGRFGEEFSRILADLTRFCLLLLLVVCFGFLLLS